MNQISPFAPWIVVGLSIIGMIVMSVNSFGKKLDKSEFREERREIWEGIGGNRENISSVKVDVGEIRAEIGAYTDQLKAVVNELRKMNGKRR